MHLIESLDNKILREETTSHILEKFMRKISSIESISSNVTSLDLSKTSMCICFHHFTILRIVYPFLEAIAMILGERHQETILLICLERLTSLRVLTISLRGEFKFRGPVLNLDALRILGAKTSSQSIRSLMEKVGHLDEIFFQECMISYEMIQIIQHENIHKICIINSDIECSASTLRMFLAIKHYPLTEIEIVDVYTDPLRASRSLTERYLREAPHENLKCLTFSITHNIVDYSRLTV